MTILDIIKGTPFWVWILFFFLVNKGINMFFKSKTSIKKLLLLPLVFFIWSIYSLLTHLLVLDFAFGGYLMGGIVGFYVGYIIYSKADIKLKQIGSTNVFEMPGSILPLVMILVAFFSKYLFLVYLAIHRVLSSSTLFCGFFGLVSGIITGMFWGRSYFLILPIYKNIQNSYQEDI